MELWSGVLPGYLVKSGRTVRTVLPVVKWWAKKRSQTMLGLDKNLILKSMPLAWVALLALLSLCGTEAARPSGLLVDGRRTPAVGIASAAPRYTWVVPHLACGATNQRQVAYQLQVRPRAGVLADTGRVESGDSVDVVPGGAGLKQLSPTTRYSWRVRAWTDGCSADASEWSSWAHFQTAPFSGLSALCR